MIGFTFRGKHSYDDFGIVMRSKSRPVLPEKRKRQLDIPGRSGTYDFSGDDYENRVIVLECFIDCNAIPALRQHIRRVAAWLAESGQLAFDDEPNKRYDARVYTAVSLEQAMTAGLFTLVFECQPFAAGDTVSVTAAVTNSGQEISVPYHGTRPAGCRIVIVNKGTQPLENFALRIRKE